MSLEFKRRLRNLRWLLPASDPRQRLGAKGERIAARFLRRHGHRILARNYRCPTGEIDLITSHGDQIVFVEVKTRAGLDLHNSQELVKSAQWNRIERAARFFRLRFSVSSRSSRFDLVAVRWQGRWKIDVDHSENAHQPRNLS